MTSWVVLQKPISIYDDEEGVAYHYPLRIPNGRQIKEGDYLICTLTSKESKDGQRIFGIGRVEEIEINGEEAKAYYGWYREFDQPFTFEQIGGDPRNNQTNSINRVPVEKEKQVLRILLKEIKKDKGVEADEHRMDHLFKQPEGEELNWDEPLVEAVREIFASIFRSQNAMKALVPQFGWRGMGNMLGDFGEFMVLNHLELKKAPTGMRDYDAMTKDGKTVQIKTVFVSSTIGLRGTADLLLVIRVNSDGEWKIIYYGDYEKVKSSARYGKRDNKHAITVKKLIELNKLTLSA